MYKVLYPRHETPLHVENNSVYRVIKWAILSGPPNHLSCIAPRPKVQHNADRESGDVVMVATITNALEVEVVLK